MLQSVLPGCTVLGVSGVYSRAWIALRSVIGTERRSTLQLGTALSSRQHPGGRCRYIEHVAAEVRTGTGSRGTDDVGRLSGAVPRGSRRSSVATASARGGVVADSVDVSQSNTSGIGGGLKTVDCDGRGVQALHVELLRASGRVAAADWLLNTVVRSSGCCEPLGCGHSGGWWIETGRVGIDGAATINRVEYTVGAHVSTKSVINDRRIAARTDRGRVNQTGHGETTAAAGLVHLGRSLVIMSRYDFVQRRRRRRRRRWRRCGIDAVKLTVDRLVRVGRRHRGSTGTDRLSAGLRLGQLPGSDSGRAGRLVRFRFDKFGSSGGRMFQLVAMSQVITAAGAGQSLLLRRRWRMPRLLLLMMMMGDAVARWWSYGAIRRIRRLLAMVARLLETVSHYGCSGSGDGCGICLMWTWLTLLQLRRRLLLLLHLMTRMRMMSMISDWRFQATTVSRNDRTVPA